MECYNSGMYNKEVIAARSDEYGENELLREQVISRIQSSSPSEISDIVRWMCDNPSTEWPAVIYEVSHLPEFPAKSAFMNKIDIIYESCSEMVADLDRTVES